MYRMNRPRTRTAARQSLLAIAGIAAILAVVACAPEPAPNPSASPVDTSPCAGPNGVGGAVASGLGPGDLVSAVDLTPTNSSSPGFPTGATVWRILYVTTGVDETDLQLVCGTVASPAAGPKLFGDTGRMLNWAHGTVGIGQDCMPSSEPAQGFWGKMPGGINAIAWGTDLGKHEGDPADGLLQWAVDQGMVVSAADYQPDNTYVVGKMEASAILDAARAATQLMTTAFEADAPDRYDAVIWGHSQGGHAALWAGQLAETYLAGTTPSKPTADFALVGVAALAPASNFITQPDQPGVSPGDGLADWEMHKNIGLDLPIKQVQMQIGPALFSYIFGSWDALGEGRPPAADAAFPAFPTSVPPVDLASIATADPGAQTVKTVQALCLKQSQAKLVQAAVELYDDAATNQMLVPELWNLPEPYTVGEFFKGGLDTTCATTEDAALAAWCEWMVWNLPGPLGSNPYPKAPIVDSQPVPLFIAQGTNDDIIHCQPPAGSTGVPDAANCMSRALYDSLASGVYCPIDQAAGYLGLVGVQQVGLDGIVSPATHFSIPGEISARAITEDARDLVFEGSPLQKFVSAAFDGALEPGCSVTERG
ncbi:hypothetical protein BH10ACT7_BH10ACT7_24120 [soil metagenome]